MREALLDTDILSEVLRARNPDLTARARAYEAALRKLFVSSAKVIDIAKGFQRPMRRRAAQQPEPVG